MKQIWCEKYRPRTVAEVIVKSERDREKFASYVADGSFPNLLLYGGPGTGKSSMSLALIKTLGLDRSDVLKVNCSDEKIEALRDKVKNFAVTMPIGKFKVVRLEELDGIGVDAQRLLRDLMETTSGTCRFIATCNYLHLITPPLRSRFQEYEFVAPSRTDVLVKSAEVLEAEGVAFDLDDLEKVVAAGYPDFRKIIQLLESSSIGGQLKLDGGEAAADWKLQLLPLLEAGDLKACRKLVCETATREELILVYRFLYDNLHRCKQLKKQDEAVVLIAQYQFQHAHVYDPELQIAALFIELMSLL